MGQYSYVGQRPGSDPWSPDGNWFAWCRYNSNKAHQHEVDDMMEAMEGTLYQHGVDVVFAGHVHAYESSYPVFRWGMLRVDIMAAANPHCSVYTHYVEPQSTASRSKIRIHSSLHVSHRYHRGRAGFL